MTKTAEKWSFGKIVIGFFLSEVLRVNNLRIEYNILDQKYIVGI